MLVNLVHLLTARNAIVIVVHSSSNQSVLAGVRNQPNIVGFLQIRLCVGITVKMVTDLLARL